MTDPTPAVRKLWRHVVIEYDTDTAPADVRLSTEAICAVCPKCFAIVPPGYEDAHRDAVHP